MKNLLFLLAIVFLLPSCGTTGPSSGGTGGGTAGEVSQVDPCERTPQDPTKIEWMNDIITRSKIEQVIRYDHQENIVYFFKILKCCDFQSFLYDCKGNKICTDGGFTGGDCHGMFKQLVGEVIIWQAPGTNAAE